MTDAAIFLLAGLIVATIIGILYFPIKWFPVTTHFRINEKKKGELTFYRSEVYRPIFGWTGFWTSKFSGSIYLDFAWISDKEECEGNIEVYKQLKPLKK